MRFFILIYDINDSFRVLYIRLMLKMSDLWQKFDLPQSRSLSPATNEWRQKCFRGNVLIWSKCNKFEGHSRQNWKLFYDVMWAQIPQIQADGRKWINWWNCIGCSFLLNEWFDQSTILVDPFWNKNGQRTDSERWRVKSNCRLIE